MSLGLVLTLILSIAVLISDGQTDAFEVDIKAGTPDRSSVNAFGTQVYVIGDAERKSFDIEDEPLKQAVEAYFEKKPNDVFVKSPTPWDDLYKTYGWDQVHVTIEPVDAKLENVDTQPSIVKTSHLENTSSNNSTFTVSLEERVLNTVKSSWTNTAVVFAEQKITYKIGFLGTEGGGETSIHLEGQFAKSEERSEIIWLGSQDSVEVTLNPGETAKAELKANRGTMKAKVTYKVTLSGQVAVNYNPPHRDHHFWGLPINNILEAAGKAKEHYIDEIIEIGYYSDSSVHLSDRVR